MIRSASEGRSNADTDAGAMSDRPPVKIAGIAFRERYDLPGRPAAASPVSAAPKRVLL